MINKRIIRGYGVESSVNTILPTPVPNEDGT